MRPDDLIATARYLTVANRRRPQQAMLRRAVSSAYYATFHALAECCASKVIGSQAADRNSQAWQLVYRALNHTSAKDACRNQDVMVNFSPAIQDFGATFVVLQEKRHAADYDPTEQLRKYDVVKLIDTAESAITGLRGCPAREQRAFCAHVLFKKRK